MICSSEARVTNHVTSLITFITWLTEKEVSFMMYIIAVVECVCGMILHFIGL